MGLETVSELVSKDTFMCVEHNLALFIEHFPFFSSDFIAKQASKMGVELPVAPGRIREYLLGLKERQFAASADNAVGSGRNWGVFDFCNQFLQAEDAIAEAVGDLCARLRAEHNVRYAEIRFCPALHTTEGLSEERVVEAAIRGHS